MRTIPLDAVPNQSLSLNLDGNRWNVVIKEARGIMFMDLALNDQTIMLGQRVVAGTPAIPYRHLQTNGNFLFLTDNDELPYWTQFGSSQQLVYVSPGEVADA